MKTIGLLGGMSWESSLCYYRLINEGVRARLGGLHSAQLLLYSVDFAPIERMQNDGQWQRAGEALAEAAASLERGGADFLVLCTNTMHRVADVIESRVAMPLLHIADATAQAIVARGVRRVGLLGTRFTMEQPFYRERLERQHGLEVLTPDAADRARLNRVIYEELCLGRVEPAAQELMRRIIGGLTSAGAEGVVLGCTELPMLLDGTEPAPLFDTTALHAAAAVAAALDAAG